MNPNIMNLIVSSFDDNAKTNYDYMCSETDFTQDQSYFHPTFRIPNSSLVFAAALSQNVWKAVKWSHGKCIFGTYTGAVHILRNKG